MFDIIATHTNKVFQYAIVNTNKSFLHWIHEYDIFILCSTNILLKIIGVSVY
jgi:hypothetical protein